MGIIFNRHQDVMPAGAYRRALEANDLPDILIESGEYDVPLNSLGPDFLALMNVQPPADMPTGTAVYIREIKE